MPSSEKTNSNNRSKGKSSEDPMQSVDQFTNVIFQAVDNAVEDDNNERSSKE
ncbi:hypothetical protein [Bacillus sp. M6-12]|uniref:hypothetical protein n=1 Tax=Bacillus sp. M6-12 TaxID=2054166 RepID=UPI0015E155D2|nr:hypothetical protein [Bacillus sp. M6-12]